jgi:hypothetical protein
MDLKYKRTSSDIDIKSYALIDSKITIIPSIQSTISAQYSQFRSGIFSDYILYDNYGFKI